MTILTAPLGLAGVVPTLLLVSRAVRLQLHSRSDRSGRNPDAQHADPDWADQDEQR